MSRAREVTNALADIIKEAVPGVKWNVNIIGASAGKGLEGTISCDEVTFEQDAYDVCTATVVYSIYVLDINGTTDIDDLSDTLFEVLHNNDLGGMIDNGLVKRIVFGAVANNTKAVAMLLEYQVEYDMEV